jgi:predicted chitinase
MPVTSPSLIGNKEKPSGQSRCYPFSGKARLTGLKDFQNQILHRG